MDFSEFCNLAVGAIHDYKKQVRWIGLNHPLVVKDDSGRQSLEQLSGAIQNEKIDILALRRVQVSVDMLKTHFYVTTEIDMLCHEEFARVKRSNPRLWPKFISY